MAKELKHLILYIGLGMTGAVIAAIVSFTIAGAVPWENIEASWPALAKMQVPHWIKLWSMVALVVMGVSYIAIPRPISEESKSRYIRFSVGFLVPLFAAVLVAQ